MSQEGALSLVIKGEKGGESEEAVQYVAAPDSPGTKLHRESAEDRQNTEKQSSHITRAG